MNGARRIPWFPPAGLGLRRVHCPTRILGLMMGLLLGLALGSAQEVRAQNADAEVATAFGLAAYHQGNFEEAAERFAAAVAADPGDGTASYWLGLAHVALGNGPQAVEALQRAREADRPPQVDPRRLEQDLARARGLAAGEEPTAPEPPAPAGSLTFGELPAWELELHGSAGNDSNPLLLADDVLNLTPDGTFLDGPESDSVTSVGARFEVRPVRNGPWTVALVGEGSQTLFGDFDFLDFRRLRATAQAAWGGDAAGFLAGPLGYLRVPQGNGSLGFLLQGSWTDDTLDGDGYATTTAASASLFWRQGAKGTTRFSATFRDLDFDGDGSGAFEGSGTETEGEVEQTFYLGRRDRFFSLAIAAGERDAGEAFRRSFSRGGATLGLPLGRRFTLTLTGSVEQIDFDEVESNPLFGIFPVDEIREDRITRLGAVLRCAVTPRFLVFGSVSASDRDADLGIVAEQFFDYDYQRTVATVGFRWYFLGGGVR